MNLLKLLMGPLMKLLGVIMLRLDAKKDQRREDKIDDLEATLDYHERRDNPDSVHPDDGNRDK